MAEICCGVVSESDGSCESSSRAARRRRMELRRVTVDSTVKRRRSECSSRDCDNAPDYCGADAQLTSSSENGRQLPPLLLTPILAPLLSPSTALDGSCADSLPKFGIASVCGRRRDMEDAVSIHPSFCRREHDAATGLHYFGVYDGHGCSHVNTLTKPNQLHIKIHIDTKTCCFSM